MVDSTNQSTMDPFIPQSFKDINPSTETFEQQREREIRSWEATQAALRPPKKRLIVCCDGTWQSSNHGLQSIPSNVAKISRSVAKFTRDEDGTVIHQVVFYDAGVGTATDSVESKAAGWAKKHQGAYGEGLDENVCEAYNFLVNNYNEGDEIYFFGFSRGAYTARAASGLVATVGLCKNSMMDDFYKMYNAYKSKEAHHPITDTEWANTFRGNEWLMRCDKNVNIKVVGVFDTVGALGWPNNTHFDVAPANAPYAFHNTEVHPSIENAFQALALDEHRAAFPPTLWSLPKPPPEIQEETGNEKVKLKIIQKTTNLIQCWFPGYHINIGGGSDHSLKNRKGDFESMANITFAWMVDRVQQYTSLGFSEDAMFDVIERYATNISTVIKEENPLKDENHNQVYKGWGIGPDVDSMDTLQSAAGTITRTPAQYIQGERITNECVHPVVAFALDKSTTSTWNPKALKGFQRIPNPDAKKKGFVWQKKFIAPPPAPAKKEEGVVQKTKSAVFSGFSGVYSYVRGKSTPVAVGNEVILTLPEFVLPPDAVVEGLYTAAWPGHSMERHLIRADTSRYVYDDQVGAKERKKVVLTTVDFIKRLDRENGFEESEMKIYDPQAFSGPLPDNWSTTVIPEGKLEEVLEKQWKEMRAGQAEFEKQQRENLEKGGAPGGFQQDGFQQGGFRQTGFQEGGFVYTQDGS